jgi:integrase
MGKAATGYVEYVEPDPAKGVLGHYKARISLEDGGRPWLHFKPGPCSDRAEALARELAEERGATARAERLTSEDFGIVPRKPKALHVAVPATGAKETCDDWYGRYIQLCEGLGQTTTTNRTYVWKRWISPRIGPRAMGSITRDDVENIRDALDEAVRAYVQHGKGKGAGRLSHKSAQNVWGCVTAAFAGACKSKRRDLRVLTANPCANVLPPERGSAKTKPYIHPSELGAILACDDEKVPRAWKELHAIACFTYMRPGELRVLEWSDVDFDGGVIRIHRAWDYQRGKVKPTKTKETRSIPIEPNLLPLLKAMHDRVEGKGHVVPLMGEVNEDKMAILLRRHVGAAKLKRPALLADTATELRVRFRSWRDTGITWMAIRGDDPLKIMRRAGHRSLSTTQGYITEAENASIAPGDVFPPLLALLGEDDVPAPQLPEGAADPIVLGRVLGGTEGGKKSSSDPNRPEPEDDSNRAEFPSVLYRRRDSNPHALSDGGF